MPQCLSLLFAHALVVEKGPTKHLDLRTEADELWSVAPSILRFNDMLEAGGKGMAIELSCNGGQLLLWLCLSRIEGRAGMLLLCAGTCGPHQI